MRVLLIEDDALIRNVVAEMLIAEGFDVDGLAYAEDALVLLGSGDTVDVLVTDINLGAGLSGLDLASIARARFPDVEIVFISGNAVDRDGRTPGPHEHLLLKPFRPAELIRVINEAVDAAGA